MACGIFGWAPHSFWDATPQEFYASLDAYIEANKVEDGKGSKGEAPYQSKISKEETLKVGQQLKEIQDWEAEQRRLRERQKEDNAT